MQPMWYRRRLVVRFCGYVYAARLSILLFLQRSARADRMWTTPGDDDDTTMVSKNISCCVRAVSAREIKFNWAILGFVLVCCFFPSLTNASFSFPKPLQLHFITLSPEKESVKDKYGRRAKENDDEFVALVASQLALLCERFYDEAALEPSRRIIDCHHHLWDAR